MLRVRDLHVVFETLDGVTHAVRDASWELRRGQTLALVGESGSGKSVTSFALLRLIQPPGRIAGGSLQFFPADGPPVDLAALPAKGPELLRIRGGKIGMIFQEPMTALSPVHSIGSQVVEAIRLHREPGRRAAWRLGVEALGRVGIPDPERRMKQYPFEFSGGMRQRVVIAMAVACRPEVLIADEPTTALDVTVQAQILELIRDLQQDMGTSVLFITHDLGVVAQVADEVVVMNRSRIVETAPALPLFEGPVHPYTRQLLASIPRPPPPEPPETPEASEAAHGLDPAAFAPPGGRWDTPERGVFAEVAPGHRVRTWPRAGGPAR